MDANRCYLFFKDNSIYERSKYSLMINCDYPIKFPVAVCVTSVEKPAWELPDVDLKTLELKTPNCGNPRITYYEQDEFNKTFEVKSSYYCDN